MKQGITDIELSSLPECQRTFQLHLDDTEKRKFLAAGKFADQDRIPGHNRRKSEARMIVTTSTARIEYEAIVSSQMPDDLFLHRYIPVVLQDGSRRVWYYHEIRVPGLGKWLSEVAPRAAL